MFSILSTQVGRDALFVIERAVLFRQEGVIHSDHLPPTLQTGEELGTLPGQSWDEAVEGLEREMIIDALKTLLVLVRSALFVGR